MILKLKDVDTVAIFVIMSALVFFYNDLSIGIVSLLLAVYFGLHLFSKNVKVLNEMQEQGLVDLPREDLTFSNLEVLAFSISLLAIVLFMFFEFKFMLIAAYIMYLGFFALWFKEKVVSKFLF